MNYELGSGEMGRWGDGEMGRWGDHFVRVAGGDGEMGRPLRARCGGRWGAFFSELMTDD